MLGKIKVKEEATRRGNFTLGKEYELEGYSPLGYFVVLDDEGESVILGEGIVEEAVWG